MIREVPCPACGRRLRVPAEVEDQPCTCLICRTVFTPPSERTVVVGASGLRAEVAADVQQVLPVEAPTLAEETNPFSTGFPDKSTATNRRMYAPGYATLAAFLGGPAAGIFLLALNYRALGRTAAAWGTAVAGGAVLAGRGAFFPGLPPPPPRLLFFLYPTS